MQRIDAYAHGDGAGTCPSTSDIGISGTVSFDGLACVELNVFTPGSVFCTYA